MKILVLFLASLLSHFALWADTLSTPNVATDSAPVERILKHWQSPSSDYVLVVAHRAAFMRGRQIVLPENSLASVAYAISLGVDMVELDIRATRDGRFVILHDSSVDRTTNGSGLIKDLTFAQVRQLRLINEVTGEPTEEKVPSLEEVYALVKGLIMVNLDPKLNITQLSEALEIAKNFGVERQIILKGNADTSEQIADIKTLFSQLSYQPDFMPMHRDARFKSIEQIEQSFALIQPHAAEMLVTVNSVGKDYATESGGVLFSDKVKALAKKFDTHLWINTLYVEPLAGKYDLLQWNGGRHDVLGLKYPDEVFGFWIAHGATIIQTDEPEFLISYLKTKGYRQSLFKPR